MAQPNVVREPSMDEILASIRRIIESNDPVPGIGNAMPEPDGFSGSAANDDMEDVPLTIDDTFAPAYAAAPARMPAPVQAQATRHEHIEPMSESRLRAAHDAEDAAGQPAMSRTPDTDPAPEQKSLSLADVAARVRAASERNPGLRDLAPRAEAERAPALAPVSAAKSDPEAAATSPLMTGRMTGAAPAVSPPAVSSPIAHAPIDWNDIVPRAEQSRPAVDAEAVSSDQTGEPEQETVAPSSLISLDAGQQVARSFQDLAVAVDQAERRSHDEIAADLLRPMLQEWLDENLPTLVERLVREEIERVARGTRR